MSRRPAPRVAPAVGDINTTMLTLLALPIVVALASPGSPPQNAPDTESADASFDFAPIDTRIERLDYEDARELLLIALARADLDDITRRDLHLRAGTVDRVLNHDDESKMHFQEALSIDGDAALPPGESPKIVTYFQLVKNDFHRHAAREAAPALVADPPAVPNEAEPALPMGGLVTGGLGAALVLALAPVLAMGAGATYFLVVDNHDASASERNAGRTLWLGLSGAAVLSAGVGAVVLASGAGMVLFAD